tara:strand:- start:195 stop:890 length:696 start_codon:yes stop_codon:yes gene_type:complete
MARRKNTKRIDPRYFLNETAYRDINEAPEFDQRLEQLSALISKNEVNGIGDNPASPDWSGVPRANTKQGPYELRIVTNVKKDDPNAAEARQALKKETSHMKDTIVDFDRSGRLSLVTGHPNFQGADNMANLASSVINEHLPAADASLAFYTIRYNIGGLPCGRGVPAGYPGWLAGNTSSMTTIANAGGSAGYSLNLIQTDSSGNPSGPGRNEDMIKAALLHAELKKMCKGS